MKQVFTVKTGDSLIKGGEKANQQIHDACRKIQDRFLCYYWKTGDEVLYVGSVTKDYKNKNNNLIGRIGNYLQNHNGTTNLRVFGLANTTLKKSDLEFGIFAFSSLKINGEAFEHSKCAENSDLMYMIENVLIGYFKSRKQCVWNR